ERAALDAPWDLIADIDPEAPKVHTAAPVIAPANADPLSQLLAQLGPVDWRHVRHLALHDNWILTVVRRLGEAAPHPEPSPYRLSVAFMAAQPNGMDQLQVDREEAAIVRAVGGIGMDLAVEDSGSLRGLTEMVARTPDCDVMQVSCHG